MKVKRKAGFYPKLNERREPLPEVQEKQQEPGVRSSSDRKASDLRLPSSCCQPWDILPATRSSTALSCPTSPPCPLLLSPPETTSPRLPGSRYLTPWQNNEGGRPFPFWRKKIKLIELPQICFSQVFLYLLAFTNSCSCKNQVRICLI